MSVAEIDRTAGTKDWLMRSKRVEAVTFATNLPSTIDQLPEEMGVGTNTNWKFCEPLIISVGLKNTARLKNDIDRTLSIV